MSHRAAAPRRALTCALVLATTTAAAQNPPAPTATLETVTVTARQAEEDLQDVPLSVTVLDGLALEQQGITHVNQALDTIADVNRYSTGDPLYDNFTIRGMGTIGNISMDNDAVALNLNGSTVPNRGFGMGLLDVERIEVLKGPQGTLMGRNSTAGAVNVVTHRPQDTFGAYVQAEVGNHRHHEVQAMLNTPLAEGWKARVALRQGQDDHWVENVNTGRAVSRPRNLAVRGSLQWDISPDTNALLTLEHHRQERFAALMLMHPYGDTPQTDLTPGSYDENRKHLSRYALEINHRLANSQFTSITAIDRDRYDAVSANDRTLMRLAYGVDAEEILPLRVHVNGVTQDLRLSSLPGANLFWVTGVNYWQAKRTFQSEYPSQQSAQDKQFRNHSYAVYGEATYPVLERLKLTAGLRYTVERKRFEASYHWPGLTLPDERHLRDNYLTGRIALAYDLSPGVNTYVSFARGYRPGGVGDYAAQPDDSMPYAASRTHYVEWGWKLQSADGRARLDAALFLADTKQEQVSTYDPLTYFIRYYNLDARSHGAELEGSFMLAPGLRVRGGVAYTRAVARQALIGLLDGDVARGNRLPGVPTWKGVLGLDYTQALPAFAGLRSPTLTFAVDLRHEGARASDIQNAARLKAYTVVDTRLTLGDAHHEVYAYAHNLFDKRYEMYRYVMGPGLALGAQQRGRSVGMGYRYTF